MSRAHFHERGSTTSAESQGPAPGAGGWRGQLRRELAGLTLEEQKARVSPGPAVQMRRDPSAAAADAASPSAAPAVQFVTTIVDDPSDPQNTAQPGTGKGLLKQGDGQINPTVEFGGLLNDCGTYMSALLIPSVDDLGGTEPKGGTWPDWWAAAAPSSNTYWVRGHLGYHNIGGPGEKRNLTPITKKCNSDHHNLVEKLCKAAAAKGYIVGYTVTPLYDGTGPTGLKGDAYDPKSSVWGKITTGFQCQWDFQDQYGNDIPGNSLFIVNQR